MNYELNNHKSGFTLLEMLIVLTIIAILATIVFVSLDPITQFAEGRNARRWSDVNNISTAMYRFIIKNKSFPAGIDEKVRQLGTLSSGCNTVCINAEASCLDISGQMKPYLDSIPLDPKAGSTEKTYYTVSKNSNNVILITACNAENNATIQVSR